MKLFRRLSTIIIISSMVVFGSMLGAYAQETETLIDVNMDVEFLQTDARTMLEMVNDFRTGSDSWYYTDEDKQNREYVTGLGQLTWNSDLEKVAMQRAIEAAFSFSHTRPDGTRCFSATYNGVSSYGENLAAGNPTAETSFVQWQEIDYGYSGQGHRRNMLGKEWKSMAIAAVRVNGICYWVQEFSPYYSNNSEDTTTGFAATAVDGNQTGRVTVEKSQISQYDVSLSDDSITVTEDSAASLPVCKMQVIANETWPYWIAIQATVPDVNWQSEDPDVANVSNNQINGAAPGSTTLKATVMGQDLTLNVDTLCKNHKWDAGTVTKVPTCSATGSLLKNCTVCVATETDVLAKDLNNHSYGAAWVTDGTNHWHECNDCGSKGSVAAHSGGTATCTLQAKCTTCGTAYGTFAAHTPKEKAAVSPTCTETGLTEGSYCAVCNKVLVAQVVIPATGHDYKTSKEAKAATCTLAGNTEEKTCETCGDVTGGELISATGHAYNKGKVTKAPTSSKTGVRTKTCTVCGATKTVSIAKIAKTSVKSLSKKTKGFTVKWSKKTSATGYQIIYSRSSKFKSGNKTATITKNSTVSKTVKSLKAKKKYYVKVRCYKVIDGKKYYGSWSTAKSVVTK